MSSSPDSIASTSSTTAASAQALEGVVSEDTVTEHDGGSTDKKAEKSAEQSAWQVFVSTFATIFLAELGDKTQVTTLLMSAESHKPWVVFAGAGSALVATSLLGVLLGRWLATRLSPQTLEKSAGITLLVIAVWLGWDILSGL